MTSKPFDASLKDVIEGHPADWARWLGVLNPRKVQIIDADVSTVTAAADKALWVEDNDGPFILHPELQASYDSKLPKRTWWYNSVYHQRTDLQVLSTAILLRPEADGALMTGKYEIPSRRRRKPCPDFEYDIVKLWQIPTETLLSGGIGILPLAPLASDAAGQLPTILREIDRRLTAEAERDDADKLRAATAVLLGLRNSQAIIGELLKGMWPMWDHVLEDSSVIQEFVRRGEARGKRDILLRLGKRHLGMPDAECLAVIESLADSDRLVALCERIHDVKTWQELLG